MQPCTTKYTLQSDFSHSITQAKRGSDDENRMGLGRLLAATRA